MTFSEFVKKLETPYRTYFEPYYGETDDLVQPDIVRTLFMEITETGHDIFKKKFVPEKLFRGNNYSISRKVADKVFLNRIDKEKFKNFLSLLDCPDSINNLRKDFGVVSEDVSVLYDHITNCFVNFIEEAGDKENKPRKKTKKNYENAIKESISTEPILLNLNNMRFFTSENNGIKMVDSIIEKGKCSITYNRNFDNTDNPKYFAMVAYLFKEPVNWVGYYQKEYSLFFKGQLSLNITSIIIEIKYITSYNSREIAIEKMIKNNNGYFEGEIKLSEYDIDLFSKIIEICFTVFNENCTSIGEHMIEVNHLSVGTSSQTV